MASSDVISCNVDFTSTQGDIKAKTFEGVRASRLWCVRDFKEHLKLTKGITGRILMNKKELNINKMLKELGIGTGTVLVMKSYTKVKDFNHSIGLKCLDGTVIIVQVHEGTTIKGLKHIILNEVGMPVEEQVLEHGGTQIMQDKKLVVDICSSYKKIPIVLKSRKFNLC